VVEEDTLLCLRKEQIMVDGQEETVLACYWVTDGIDRCRIGFLKCHIVVASVLPLGQYTCIGRAAKR